LRNSGRTFRAAISAMDASLFSFWNASGAARPQHVGFGLPSEPAYSDANFAPHQNQFNSLK